MQLFVGICIVLGLAFLVLLVYSLCVASGRAAQWEEDNLDIRRS